MKHRCAQWAYLILISFHSHRFSSEYSIADRWNAQTSRTCNGSAKPYRYQPDFYIYRCSATFFNDVVAMARNSSGFDRIPSRFPFGSRRWYRRISGELHAVDLPQSTLSTSSSEIGNTFCPSDWVLSADTSANARPALELECRFFDIFADRSFRGAMCAEGRYDITGI